MASTTHPPARPPLTSSTSTTTSTASISKSTSTSTTASPPPLTIDPTALVADKATLTGIHPITVRAHATIHPFARLDSHASALDIGPACTIWEKATVGSSDNAAPAPSSNQSHSQHPNQDPNPSTTPPTTTLGPNTIISPHATIAAQSTIGANTRIDVGASVGPHCTVGSYCHLAPTTSLEAGASLDDYTVLFFDADGEQRRRVDVSLRDFDRARELEAKGRERARVYVGKIVKGAAAAGKWK